MSLKLSIQLKAARREYVRAVAEARRHPGEESWARLFTAGRNLAEALFEASPRRWPRTPPRPVHHHRHPAAPTLSRR